MGLIARLLEQEGIATTLTSSQPGMTRPTAPPRAVYTKLNTGKMLGAPGDVAQQRRVLEATLGMLEQDAPAKPLKLGETCD